MANRVDGGTFTVEIEQKAMQWSSTLAKATWAIIVVGVIVGGILWVTIDGATGQDVGALAWVISFSAAIAVMSIRQIILAERQ
ncbi:hypothetical protein SAMN06265174_103266 [Dietzia kunjamensis subsp. schimae]|uniref:DUF2631 domain-containing protein n=1 Tax=Dietzia kunjamensis subsp. schimae TaxID=498198 RepID=A0ABY1N0X9_9ACTN|nr:hypothetical protein [Dietzia kunjamensis]MBB1015287.1 hypothetical protein [Dietzia kunjamensis subsp. schimae]SMO67311.1 hypothetical protein SAMN06265174_103266 [Dietzia kunjamensis subsp. schimae]